MSVLLDQIKELVRNEDVRISAHGYDELANDGLEAREIVKGLAQGVMIEEYADYPKGPCVLVLQQDGNGFPVHVLWGVPTGHSRPGVLITAYRPDPRRWSPDFKERKP